MSRKKQCFICKKQFEVGETYSRIKRMLKTAQQNEIEFLMKLDTDRQWADEQILDKRIRATYEYKYSCKKHKPELIELLNKWNK